MMAAVRHALPRSGAEKRHRFGHAQVQAQSVVGLAYLPLLPPIVALERFAEVAYLVCNRLVGGRSVQEVPHPADAVGRRARRDQLRALEELGKLLQRRFGFSHAHARRAATSVPRPRRQRQPTVASWLGGSGPEDVSGLRTATAPTEWHQRPIAALAEL